MFHSQVHLDCQFVPLICLYIYKYKYDDESHSFKFLFRFINVILCKFICNIVQFKDINANNK